MKYVSVPLKFKGSSECAQNGLILGLTFTLNFGHPHKQTLKQLSLSHQEPTQKKYKLRFLLFNFLIQTLFTNIYFHFSWFFISTIIFLLQTFSGLFQKKTPPIK